MGDRHEIVLPVKVVIGSDVLSGVVDVAEEIVGGGTGKRVGVITGPNTYEVAGKKIEEDLKRRGFEVFVWRAQEASLTTAEELSKDGASRKIDLVLGVGGGKSIDLAKYVAYKTNVPMVSVPLAPSHDGIASPFASLKGTGRPTSIYVKTPYAIIADVDLIAKSPRRLVLAGFGDIVGKLVAVKDWLLAHKLRGEYYGEYAAQLALLSAKHVLRYHDLIGAGTKEGVRILVEALISSGVAMCIAGSSRPASGSEHLFSHALDVIAPNRALHGEKVALGTVIMLYIYGDPMWKKVKKVMEKIGLPTKASELGYTSEEVVEALTMAHKIRPERYTILGETGLSREAARRILETLGII